MSFDAFSRCRSSQTGRFMIIWYHFFSCRSIFRWLSMKMIFLSFSLSFCLLSFFRAFFLSRSLIFRCFLNRAHACLSSRCCYIFLRCSFASLLSLVASLHVRYSGSLLLSLLSDLSPSPSQFVLAFLSPSEFLAVCLFLSRSLSLSLPFFIRSFSPFLGVSQIASISLRLPSSLTLFPFLSGSLSLCLSLSLSQYPTVPPFT